MTLHERFIRYPTAQAVDSLAVRFNLPNHPEIQDWEYVVADSSRLDEFLDAYNSGELTDDERFTLMETILQSFEELQGKLNAHPRWRETLAILESNFNLHVYTVWYWSGRDEGPVDGEWRVAAPLRSILDRHLPRLDRG
jgi:hypothetical protein